MSKNSILDELIPPWFEQGPLDGGAGCVMLCHVHCLPSMLAFFEWFANRRIFKGRIIVVPKPYSTIPAVVERLKAMGISVVERPIELIIGHYDECCSELLRDGIRRAIQLARSRAEWSSGCRVVLVDDGGQLTEAWKRYVAHAESEQEIPAVSVQQTSSGMRKENLERTRGIVKIDMARCYAKRHFEAGVIADGIIRKVQSMGLLSKGVRAGVVGVGAIGRKLALALTAQGFEVRMYDSAGIAGHIPGARILASSGACINESDVVFGCVGACWIEEDSVPGFAGDFVSCSSRDIEYLSLLNSGRTRADANDWFSCAGTRDGAGWKIHNWGFPINFDRACEWEDPIGITLTRALLIVSVLLALRVGVRNPCEIVSIPSLVEREVVARWLAHAPPPVAVFGQSPADKWGLV
jgi:hypothetical protein